MLARSANKITKSLNFERTCGRDCIAFACHTALKVIALRYNKTAAASFVTHFILICFFFFRIFFFFCFFADFIKLPRSLHHFSPHLCSSRTRTNTQNEKSKRRRNIQHQFMATILNGLHTAYSESGDGADCNDERDTIDLNWICNAGCVVCTLCARELFLFLLFFFSSIKSALSVRWVFLSLDARLEHDVACVYSLIERENARASCILLTTSSYVRNTNAWHIQEWAKYMHYRFGKVTKCD